MPTIEGGTVISEAARPAIFPGGPIIDDGTIIVSESVDLSLLKLGRSLYTSPKFSQKLRELDRYKPSNFEDDLREIYRQLQQKPERVATGLPASKKTYRGRWVSQPRETTCLAWVTINSLVVLGKVPKVDLACGLLNRSLVSEGIDFGDAIDFLEGHQDQGIETTYDESLQFNVGKESSGNTFNPASFIGDESVSRNAAIIKACLDDNSVLLSVVETSYYFQNETDYELIGGLHGICLVGYQIHPHNQAMDVQILDPRRGKIYLPIEFLSDCFVDDRNLCVKNTGNFKR